MEKHIITISDLLRMLIGIGFSNHFAGIKYTHDFEKDLLNNTDKYLIPLFGDGYYKIIPIKISNSNEDTLYDFKDIIKIIKFKNKKEKESFWYYYQPSLFKL